MGFLEAGGLSLDMSFSGHWTLSSSWQWQGKREGTQLSGASLAPSLFLTLGQLALALTKGQVWDPCGPTPALQGATVVTVRIFQV